MNEHGLDVLYFRKRLERLTQELNNYEPIELAREFRQMISIASLQADAARRRDTPRAPRAKPEGASLEELARHGRPPRIPQDPD